MPQEKGIDWKKVDNTNKNYTRSIYLKGYMLEWWRYASMMSFEDFQIVFSSD